MTSIGTTTSTAETDALTSMSGDMQGSPMFELSFAPTKQFEFAWTPDADVESYQLLESPDSVAQVTPVGPPLEGAKGSLSLTVPLHFRLHASYVLRACTGPDCVDSDPVAVSGSLAEAVGTVVPADVDAFDNFGDQVVLSGDGNTLVVGASGENGSATGVDGQVDDAASDSGAVYVFTRAGAEWSQTAYIKASNTDSGDAFGDSLALSDDGNVLAVGAFREDSGAKVVNGDQFDNSAADAGAVYVFVRSEGQWSQQGYIKASNAGGGDNFGHGVALNADGHTLAVGAYTEDSGATGIGGDQSDDSAESAGAVYIFVRDGDGWQQEVYIKPSSIDAGDSFGRRVALNGAGDLLAVSSEDDSDATGIDGDAEDDSLDGAGAVFVFERTNLGWMQQAYLKASNTGHGDQLGFSLALSRDGSTLVVGAVSEDGGAKGINGDEQDSSMVGAGAAYVFANDGSGWTQQAYVKASNPDISDSFGDTVAISADGDVVAVAAPNEGGGAIGLGGPEFPNRAEESGAVYVFQRIGTLWSQVAYVKSPVSAADYSFGRSVGLNADGGTLAVGSNGVDDVAGVVHLY